MKKFVLLYHGGTERTPEVMDAWQRWFDKVGERFVDSGNPLGACLEVTPTGSRDISADQGAATGYSIISAESRDEALRLLEGCPSAASVRVYEAMAM
jgi:hypothetical protein